MNPGGLKPREPASIRDAATQVVGLLGDIEAGRLIGKSARLARAYGDPDDDEHHLQVRHAVVWDAACLGRIGYAPIRAAYRVQVDRLSPPLLDGDPLTALGRLLGDLGVVATSVVAAVDPAGEGGAAVTAAEVRDFLARIDGAEKSLRALRLAMVGAAGALGR